MKNPCQVIGIWEGEPFLFGAAKEALNQAQLIIGATAQLKSMRDQFPEQVEEYDLTGRLMQVPDLIRQGLKEDKKILVLATGDPMCQGIGGFLAKHLQVGEYLIHPNLSAIQWASSKLGIPWSGMEIINLHGPDLGEWEWGQTPEHGLYLCRQALNGDGPWVIYTSPGNGPDKLARIAGSIPGASFEMDVCERLLHVDEALHRNIEVTNALSRQFAEPNIVFLRKTSQAEAGPIFGRREDEFTVRKPEKGLITSLEARSVAFGLMRLTPKSYVWDIGAGSGSVGLEAAKICSKGHVWAVEKNLADYQIALENAIHLGDSNYTLIQDKAPEGMESWPAPNAVFIGGSGGNLKELIGLSLHKLQPGGRLVMALITLENLHLAQQTLKELAVEWEAVQLQTARTKPILDMHRFAGANPLWLVSARKEKA